MTSQPETYAFSRRRLTLTVVKGKKICSQRAASVRRDGDSGRLSLSTPRALNPAILRRDGDSNPGYAFDVYTLSRRASSATRASLLENCECKIIVFPRNKGQPSNLFCFFQYCLTSVKTALLSLTVARILTNRYISKQEATTATGRKKKEKSTERRIFTNKNTYNQQIIANFATSTEPISRILIIKN